MFWEVRDNGFEFNCSEGEAAQVSKIEEMFSEGKASTIGEDCYIVSHEHIAALSTNERALLDLPEIFPYRLRISANGALVDRSLRYIVDFVKPMETVLLILLSLEHISESQQIYSTLLILVNIL